MSGVSLQYIDSYDQKLLQQSITKIFDDLGGVETLIKKDAKVFLKVNALMPATPNQAITTHPEVVRAVIKEVKKVTNNIYVGDNPAIRDLELTLKKNGTLAVCNEEGVTIPNVKDTVIIENPNGIVYKSFEVSKSIIECDVLINVPKLKTHGLAYMTVSVKNLFGLIVGLNKAQWHVKANSPLSFATMLLDLYDAILQTFKDKKLLHICDGILALEGDGPGTGGQPKVCNALLGSLDGIALDRIACEIAHLDMAKNIINSEGARRKLGVNSLSEISLLSSDLSPWKDVRFVEPEKMKTNRFALKMIQHQRFKNMFLEHPVINHDLCIKCGECAKICPPDALTFEKKQFPKLNKNKCIRCWCCAEVCPEAAITKSKRPTLGRLLFRDRV